MSKWKMWMMSIVGVVVIGGGGWIGYEGMGEKSGLNDGYAFGYKSDDGVKWLKVRERKGKVRGEVKERILEENGERDYDGNVFMKKYELRGK
ncbi:hypothetical protein [Bacillus altitudinis]|uniref:hypothetical protein n=1 Tax=Bacillus altitudinis TaxID=293387 RepID=UPI0011A66EE0|nr:hypothetical protein [Bacillus altitudinis]